MLSRLGIAYDLELGSASPGRPRLLLFLAAFLFSTGGAAIKACSLTGWQVAGFRSGIAAAVLLLLLPETRRGWTWATVAAGVAYAATLIAFVVANKLTTSANAIFLQSTAPLYMLALGPLVLHEKIRKLDLAVFAAVACGAILLLEGAHSAGASGSDPARGNLVAAFSGFTWACTIASLRWLAQHDPNPGATASTVAAGNLIACGACLPMALPVPHLRPQDTAVLLYLGIFQVGLAYLFLTRSIRHVPALEAATLLLIEPVFNPLWTWLIQGERPGSLALLGGALIVFAAFFGALKQGEGQNAG
jgi:DME family drug/metabolite transporter